MHVKPPAMDLSKYSLLDEVDIGNLKLGYVNVDQGPEIAYESAGKVVLTLKGVQLYSAISEFYGVQAKFAAAKTWEQFLDFQDLLVDKYSKYTEQCLAEELRTGKIPLQERAAALATLRGDSAGFSASMAQLSECRAAGSHVIPIGSAKK